MARADFIAILPYLIMTGAATAILLAIAIRRNHLTTALIALLGLALSFASLWLAWAQTPRQVTPLFMVDGFAIFMVGLICLSSIAIAVFSYHYLAELSLRAEEYYLLLILATLGGSALAASTHFASLFLGLETLSISLLGLIAYPHIRERPIEAGIKYLILSGLSSSLLLFGIALVYSRLGTLEFAGLRFTSIPDAGARIYWLGGVALIISGLSFKLSFAPYHMWTPDVYEGAPAPVTGFIATVSKGAVFALLTRYLLTVAALSSSAALLLNVLVIASIVIGNFLALLQDNVKRMLAYSSIAHLGYLLLTLLVGGSVAIEAVCFYLSAYFVTMVGALGIITVLSNAEREAETLKHFHGLIWRRPLLGGSFALMMLSLAGIPPTMGFFAKIYAIKSGVEGSYWIATFTLVGGSMLGLFYYLRVIVAMCATTNEASEGGEREATPLAAAIVLAVLVLALIGFGVFPGPLIRLIQLVATQIA